MKDLLQTLQKKWDLFAMQIPCNAMLFYPNYLTSSFINYIFTHLSTLWLFIKVCLLFVLFFENSNSPQNANGDETESNRSHFELHKFHK